MADDFNLNLTEAQRQDLIISTLLTVNARLAVVLANQVTLLAQANGTTEGKERKQLFKALDAAAKGAREEAQASQGEPSPSAASQRRRSAQSALIR